MERDDQRADDGHGGKANDFDGEHELQIRMLNAFRAAVARGDDKATLAGLFDNLIEFTTVHFMSEQVLMRFYSYPGFDAHQQEHDQVLEQLDEMDARFRAGDEAMTAAVADHVQRLLVEHIGRADQALATFIGQQATAGAGE